MSDKCNMTPNTDPNQEAGRGSGPRPRWQHWLAGIVIGDLVVALLYGLGLVLLERATNVVWLFGVPSFFLMPAVGGLVASFFWSDCRPTTRETLLNTLWMSLLALVGALVAFHEGAICLLILFPLYY